MRVMITGANGHLGRRLTARLAADHDVVAAVRSERARGTLLAYPGGTDVDVPVVDYADPASLARVAERCSAIIHLVGIIKESAGNRYEDAHEASSRALIEAAERVGIKRIICVSILGSDIDSANPCLASKARGEDILLTSSIGSMVLRVPMVLGEHDYASRALKKKGARKLNFEVRASSLEQPLYAGDLTEALVNSLDNDMTGIVELAGPECVSRRELIGRAARTLGLSTRVVSLPLLPVRVMVRLMELVSSNPPVTAAMLGVLDHDDCIDPAPACERLGVKLTPLDETLDRVVRL